MYGKANKVIYVRLKFNYVYERLGAHKMSNRIQILDCTLRDGGLGLEDSKKNKISSMQFDLDSVNDIIDKLAKSKVDIIELGSIEISEENKVGYDNLQ